jgi:UDP-N-acetylglucosamine:LPS N-acetylglucosamine transferase
MALTDYKNKKKRILFISSSGGHWIQMRRLESAFEGYEKYYAATDPSYQQSVDYGYFFSVPEASRWNKLKLIWQALKIFGIILYIKPAIVFSTGAAPGFFALFFAKKLGIKTIWLDSIANVEELSLSGRKVKPYADLWLTQWEHLAKPEGPYYYGAVL